MKNCKIPLVAPDGTPIYARSFGMIRIPKKHSVESNDSDLLIQTLRQINLGNPAPHLTDKQSELVRSFVWAITHLSRPDEALFQTFDRGLPLPDSTKYIWRIGMFDRAARATVGIGSALSIFALTLEGFDSSASIGAELALDLIGFTSFLHQVESNFGEPGTPVYRADFQSEQVLFLLRMLRMRSLISNCQFESSAEQHINARLDYQLFRLFIVNSRQLSGLVLAGQAEASSAVVAYTVIALMLDAVSDGNEIVKMLEERIYQIHRSSHYDEAVSTLNRIKETLKGDTKEINRKLNRYLMASSSSEALDFAAQPLRVAFELVGTVANGLGCIAGGGDRKSGEGNLFKAVGSNLKRISTAIDAAPDLATHAMNQQIAAEQWTRDKIDQLWNSVWKRSAE